MPVGQVDETRGGGKPPVSAHPAFPAIVALWFAALFGLGSLIMPAQPIESLVSASGIASLVPAAAPPLGFTARAGIALAATLSGAVLGYLAARRITAPGKREQRRGDMIEHRVFNLDEDIGEAGVGLQTPSSEQEPSRTTRDRPAPIHGRRRALAIESEEGPSDFLPQAVLLQREAPDEDTLELSQEDEMAEEPDPAIVGTDEEEDGAELMPRQEFIVQETDGTDADAASDPVDEAVQPEQDEPATTTAGTPSPEPLAFSPPSMARQPDPSHDETVVEVTGPTETNSQPAMPEDPLDARDASDDETEVHSENDVTDKQSFDDPLAASADRENSLEEGVGLVQLVQKLGSTLERHRQWSARQAEEKAAHASEPPALPEDFEAAPADDAAAAMAAYFGKNTETASPAIVASAAQRVTFKMPEAVEPEEEQAEIAPALPAGNGLAYAPFNTELRLNDEFIDEEDEDVAELAASFALPLGEPHLSAQPQHPSGPIPDDGPDGAGDSPESGNPFKRDTEDFVRVEEPEPETAQPTVVFPNQESRQTASPPLETAAPAEDRDVPASGGRAFDPPADYAEKRATPEQASNDDNDRALREALMNLQRMSK